MPKKSYWYAVLQEVLHKECSDYEFAYTTLGDHFREEAREKERVSYKKREKRYFLGEPYPEIYLTQREYECFNEIMLGKTITQAAVKLEISPRTVEFYLKNMRIKLQCHTRSELVQALLKSELMLNVQAPQEKKTHDYSYRSV